MDFNYEDDANEDEGFFPLSPFPTGTSDFIEDYFTLDGNNLPSYLFENSVLSPGESFSPALPFAATE